MSSFTPLQCSGHISSCDRKAAQGPWRRGQEGSASGRERYSSTCHHSLIKECDSATSPRHQQRLADVPW